MSKHDSFSAYYLRKQSCDACIKTSSLRDSWTNISFDGERKLTRQMSWESLQKSLPNEFELAMNFYRFLLDCVRRENPHHKKSFTLNVQSFAQQTKEEKSIKLRLIGREENQGRITADAHCFGVKSPLAPHFRLFRIWKLCCEWLWEIFSGFFTSTGKWEQYPSMCQIFRTLWEFSLENLLENVLHDFPEILNNNFLKISVDTKSWKSVEKKNSLEVF